VTILISDIMNVIVTSKKVILDIWNIIDIRNTFSDIKTSNKYLLVTIELLISRIDISTSDNLIIDIRNSHFTSNNVISKIMNFY